MSAFSIPILGEYPSGNNVNECSDGQGAYDEGNINWRMSGVSFWDRDRDHDFPLTPDHCIEVPSMHIKEEYFSNHTFKITP